MNRLSEYGPLHVKKPRELFLLSSRKLERALAGGKLRPWAKVKYLILPAVLAALSSQIYILRSLYGTATPTLNQYVFLLCAALSAYLTYWGIKRCFQTNRAIDGNAFFERFAVLFVPPLIKVMLVTLAPRMVVSGAANALREQVPLLFERVSIFFAALGPLATFAMYILLNSSFRRLGKIIKSEEPESPKL